MFFGYIGVLIMGFKYEVRYRDYSDSINNFYRAYRTEWLAFALVAFVWARLNYECVSLEYRS